MTIFKLALIAALSVILFDSLVCLIVILVNKNKGKSKKEFIMLSLKYITFSNIIVAAIIQIIDYL